MLEEGRAYIFTSERIPTQRECLVTVCMKSLNAFFACCSDKLQHPCPPLPTNMSVSYFLCWKCSKVHTQTPILAHFEIRLSSIQTGVTIIEVCPAVPETHDKMLFSSKPQSHSSKVEKPTTECRKRCVCIVLGFWCVSYYKSLSYFR